MLLQHCTSHPPKQHSKLLSGAGPTNLAVPVAFGHLMKQGDSLTRASATDGVAQSNCTAVGVHLLSNKNKHTCLVQRE